MRGRQASGGALAGKAARRRLDVRRVMIAALAAVAVLGLFSASASAVGTDYTLSPGGTTSEAIANSGSLVFQDTTSATAPAITCTGAGGAGVAIGGGHTFLPIPAVAPYTGYDEAVTITSMTLTGCTNPTVGPMTATLSVFPWHLGCTSKSYSWPAVVGCGGYMYGVQLRFDGKYCTLTVAGLLYGSYANATHTFTSSSAYSGLKLSAVSGALCQAAQFANNDVGHIAGALVFSPAFTIS